MQRQQTTSDSFPKAAMLGDRHGQARTRLTIGINSMSASNHTADGPSTMGNESSSCNARDFNLNFPCTGESVDDEVTEGNGRPGSSSDGQRLSGKRKTVEGISGHLSLGGSPSTAEGNGNSTQDVGARCEVADPRCNISNSNGLNGTEAGDLNRNTRLRANHFHHQDLAPSNVSAGNTIDVSSRSVQPSMHYVGFPFSGANSGFPQNVSSPDTERNMHPFSWNRASPPRVVTAENFLNNVSFSFREEGSSSRMPAAVVPNAMFFPAGENRLPRDRSNANANVSIIGTPGLNFQVGSSSGVYRPFAPMLLPHYHLSSHYPQPLTQLLRPVQLTTVLRFASLPQLVQSVPSASSQPVAYEGHHHQYPRPPLTLEGQGNEALPLPPFVDNEHRRRVYSEMRNVVTYLHRRAEIRVELDREDVEEEFPEEADLNDQHSDMRLEIDDMSYEELLELEEQIGDVKTGLNEEDILQHLKMRKYSPNCGRGFSEDNSCCICQEEYVTGENLGVLDCAHKFHVACLKEWLLQKNSCPICKTKAVVTGNEN